jgi:hypothetical protein
MTDGRASPTAASTVRVCPIRRARSARNPARKRMRSTFPSSEGWSWNEPIEIQRFEPRTSAPTSTTIAIERIITA